MNRKEIAEETLMIQRQGFYEVEGRRIDFASAQKHSEDHSELITPERGKSWYAKVPGCPGCRRRPPVPSLTRQR